MLCVIAGGMLLGGLAPPARAGGVAPVKVGGYAQGGDDRVDVFVLVRTGLPRTRCSGRAREHGVVIPLPALKTGAKGGARWHWQIAPGTPAGTMSVRATCRGDARGTAVTRFGVPPGTGAGSAVAGVVAIGSLRIEPYIPSDKGTGSGGDAADLYPRGQCTWFVATIRRDLPFFYGRDGDALNWMRAADRVGLPTGSAPREGAVAVFQPGQYEAGAYGHVAIVTAVHPNGAITIVEANYKNMPPGSTRTIPWAGLGFIYRASEPRNRPPELRLTKFPPFAISLTRYDVCADAADPDGDAIEVLFKALRGTTTETTRPMEGAYCTIYTAPQSPGVDTITATVADSTERRTRTITIAVCNDPTDSMGLDCIKVVPPDGPGDAPPAVPAGST